MIFRTRLACGIDQNGPMKKLNGIPKKNSYFYFSSNPKLKINKSKWSPILTEHPPILKFFKKYIFDILRILIQFKSEHQLNRKMDATSSLSLQNPEFLSLRRKASSSPFLSSRGEALCLPPSFCFFFLALLG